MNSTKGTANHTKANNISSKRAEVVEGGSGRNFSKSSETSKIRIEYPKSTESEGIVQWDE